MRLTPVEAAAIRQYAHRFFGESATIRLFGSRVDDALTGGDIDLYIEAEAPELATLKRELAFKQALQDAIGEQRIDVLVRPPGHAARAIDRIALSTGVPL
jgi:predicted nucleotidyltransferase